MYLMVVFSIIDVEGEVTAKVRVLAGLSLKTVLLQNFHRTNTESLNFIKDKLVLGFTDPDPKVRKGVITLMTTMIKKGGYRSWPALLDFLTTHLQSEDQTTLESAIEAISYIVDSIVEESNLLFED